jgi:hypothetical protein
MAGQKLFKFKVSLQEIHVILRAGQVIFYCLSNTKMKIWRFLIKLFFGKEEHNLLIEEGILIRQWGYLKAVWENDRHNDVGLERIMRLFLIFIQFFFPGLYIRYIFARYGLTYKNLAIELYIIFKILFPLWVLFSDEHHNFYFQLLSIYFLLETILYIAALVFVSDIFVSTRSSNRAILLLLFNYMEITFNFALMYSGFNLLSENAIRPVDFLYFSFVTSASLGFGDIHPVYDGGKLLVCAQSFIFLVFVVLFINFFNGRRQKSH